MVRKGIVPVRLEIKDSAVKAELQQIIQSVEGFRIQNSDTSAPFELLIMEVGYNFENEFKVVESLLNLGTINEVFLTSSVDDPTILVQALRSGAREFLSQPIDEVEVRQALGRFAQRKVSTPQQKPQREGLVYNIVGTKGGVGTTTVAVNLAIDLVQTQCSVVLVDMNLHFGEIPLFLDIEPSYNWGELAKNVERLDSTLLMSVLHKHESGLYVLPAPTRLHDQMSASPEIMEHLIVLLKEVFDYVVVDCAQATDELSRKVLEQSDTVLLVAILTVPCLANTKRFLRFLYDLGIDKDSTKIIVNRYMPSSEISLKDGEKSLDRKIFATIPNDFKVTMSSINQGRVIKELSPRSAVNKSIKKLADSLTTKQDAKECKGGFFGFFKRSK